MPRPLLLAAVLCESPLGCHGARESTAWPPVPWLAAASKATHPYSESRPTGAATSYEVATERSTGSTYVAYAMTKVTATTSVIVYGAAQPPLNTTPPRALQPSVPRRDRG